MHKITIETAHDDNPIPLIDSYIIHSKYAPVQEGLNLCKTLLDQRFDPDYPIVIFGLGFGYHILPLLKYFKQVYVIESLSPLIEIAKQQRHLSNIFSKITLIDSLEKTPYLPFYESITLRSEMRFQELFFNQVRERLSHPKSNEAIQYQALRILVNSPIYGGSLTSSEYVKNAFKSLDCTVEYMDNSIADNLLQYLLQMKKYSHEVTVKLTQLLSDLLWEKCQRFKPHIVFCLAQAPIDREVIQAIRKMGIIVAFWFVEDFRRFDYWQDVSQYVDYFFTIQKGDFLKQLQHNCLSDFLPMAADPSVHKIADDHSKSAFFQSDISFMGAAFSNRVNFFSHFTELNLKLWGSGWYEYDIFKHLCPLKDQRISIEDSTLIYQNSKININLHSSMDHQMFDREGDFVNPRTFEISLCKGFQMSDDRSAVREFFTPDENIVLFSSIDEAIDKCKFYLKNDHIREKIALNAYHHVDKYHTYAHRMRTALSFIQDHSPKLQQRISNEQQLINDIKMQIHSEDFNRFLLKLNPALIHDPEYVIQTIKNDSDQLHHPEAIILLLETFLNGE